MSLFRKPVKLRGFLGRDAGVPTPQTNNEDSCVALALLVESAIFDNPAGLRIVRTTQIPVVCAGPDFCGVSLDMKEDDHIEVEGELRLCEEDGPVMWSREPRVMRIGGIKVRASRVHKVDSPASCTDSMDGG